MLLKYVLLLNSWVLKYLAVLLYSLTFETNDYKTISKVKYSRLPKYLGVPVAYC